MQEVYWERREGERERPYQSGDIRKIEKKLEEEESSNRKESDL